MTTNFLSADTFLAMHDWVRVFSLVLLGLGLVYAIFEYLRASAVTGSWWARGGNSLRIRVITGLMVVGIIPAIFLALFLAERSAHLRQDRLMGRLEESAIATAGAVDQFIDKHRAGVMTAASAASTGGSIDRESLTRWLLLYHEIYADFLTMLSTDIDGNVVAATSDMTGFLVSVPELVAHNVADRPYFHQPMTHGGHFVSKVFRGRDLGSDPIVAVSAPLLGEAGKRVGIVEGSLDLSAFRKLDEGRVQSDKSAMILVDQNGRVIYASAQTGLTQLETISSDPMITTALATGRGYEYVTETNTRERRFVGASAVTQNGWTVYFRAPLSQISNQMLGDYVVGVFALLSACVLSLLLSGSIVRRTIRSVSEMNDAIASFSLDGSEEKVRTPTNTPSEFRPIFKQMRKRSAALKRTHKRLSHSIESGRKLQSELTQAIALKELEIGERTAELEEANRQLSSLSKVDALTGIANRREFDSFVEHIWRVGVRERTPIAIIMMDIDYFKPYNDILGHQAGDECLCKVAEALKSGAMRPLDLVARYGGEEFVAVLGHASVTEALIVAERMRNAVTELQIVHPDSPHQFVSVSIGVASVIPSQDAECMQTVKVADAALYVAKAAGRNCVVYEHDGANVKYEGQPVIHGVNSVVAIRSGD